MPTAYAGMLCLRRYTPSDREAFASLFTDGDVMRYVGDGVPLDNGDALALFEHIFEVYRSDPAFFVWAIVEDGEYAGHAELKRRNGREDYEIIYILQPKRWGRSLGGTTVDMLVSVAKHRGISRVIATVYPENGASIAILSRRGFLHDAQLSDSIGALAYGLELE